MKESMKEERTPLLDTRVTKDNKQAKWRPERYRQLVVMLCCFYLQAVCLGISVSLGLIYVDLIVVFDSPRSQAALVQSVYKGLTIGSGVIFTKSLTKSNLAHYVVFGSLLACIGLAISAFVDNIPMVIAFTGVLAGCGMGIVFLASFVAVSWSFGDSRKIALAALTIASTLGQSVFPFICDGLLILYTWSGALLILGGFALNGVVAGLILHITRDIYRTQEKQTNNLQAKETAALFIKRILSDKILMLIAFFSFTFNLTAAVETLFLADLLFMRAMPSDLISANLSTLGMTGLVGRCLGILLIRLTNNKSTSIHMIYAFLFLGASHQLIEALEEVWNSFGGTALRGLSVGIIVAASPGMHLDLRGVERYPETVAINNLFCGVAQMLSGYFGGLIVDLSGDYFLVFLIASAGALFDACLSVVLLIISVRKKRAADKYQSITSESEHKC